MWFLTRRTSRRPAARPSARGRRTGEPAGPPTSFRPRLEALEGRDLPSFSPLVVSPTYDGTVALATGDVNGDGKPELITAANDGWSIRVRLNTGNGTFGTSLYSLGGAPGTLQITALAVGLYNGKPSIWAASYHEGWGNGGERTDVSIFQVTSKGTLIEVQDWAPTSYLGPISSLALADVNGDGQTDLVAVPEGGAWLYVARASSGTPGGFGPVQRYSIPGTLTPSLYGPARVAVGDFNGDGKPDVVATDTQFNAVSVLLNTGAGTLGAAQTYAVGGDPAAVAVGDVSGDGIRDVVTANANGTVSVLLGQGNGSFGAAQNYAVGGAATSVALGDFNQDGRLDIATTGSTAMDLLLNTGNGTFGMAQQVGPAGSDVIVADFNGDGLADLAQIDASGAAIDLLLTSGGTPTQKGHK